MELTPRPTDVLALVQRGVSVFNLHAKEKGLNMTSDFRPAVMPPIAVDGLRLQQVRRSHLIWPPSVS
jgi:signal transduction histidine kinase